jgi:hypothetical protein
VSGAGGIGGSNQPQVLQVAGCPDEDCNGKYTIQPHKIVNGYARYLKNHSFYYLYKTREGHWMITWFEVREKIMRWNSECFICKHTHTHICSYTTSYTHAQIVLFYFICFECLLLIHVSHHCIHHNPPTCIINSMF